MTDIQLDETRLAKEGEGRVALTALERLKRGEIADVIACFAERFQFKDRGLGLEFTDPNRLAEFFRKCREFYPDSSLQTDKLFVIDEYVITEWTLRTTLTEPFWGGQSMRIPIELRGASVMQCANGKIVDWTDYYDGVSSRRTALAAHFEEWEGL